jgi:DNA-binding response OmpR family regulator
MRCLIHCDDPAPMERFVRLLRERGWSLFHNPAAVGAAADGQDGFDLVLLGVETDVVAACGRFSDAIVMIVGNVSAEIRQAALALGVSEIVFPAIPLDLFEAKLGALLRLRPDKFRSIYRLNDIEIDVLHRRVRRDGHDIDLSRMEFQLLAALAKNQGETVPRSVLLEHLWEDDSGGDDNALETLMSRLRRKLQLSGAERIVTVRGVGYRLGTAPSDSA